MGLIFLQKNIAFAEKNKSKNQFYIADMSDFKMKKQYGYIFNFLQVLVILKMIWIILKFYKTATII